MAHGVKYRLEYYRLHGGQTTIDILERDYAGAVTALTGAGDPLQITWEGNAGNIYEPTIGSGATIKLICTTPLQLLGLFTNDPQKYMVKIYNGASGSTLRWQGFINAEVYSEGYSNPIYSEVTLQCNDGMQVLGNLKYLQADGSYYTDAAVFYGVGEGIIYTILSKLALTFVDIYNNSTIITGDLEENDTLSNLMQMQENYIDESGEAMSCRDVLDSILGGLGLVMRFRGPYIYIYDPIDLHNFTNAEWRTAANNIGAAVDSHTAITDYLDIANGGMVWGATGSQLDIRPSYDEISVSYDPYDYVGYNADFNNADNIDPSSVHSWSDLGDLYYDAGYVGKNWDLTGLTYPIFGEKQETTDTPIYCLGLTGSSGGTAVLTVPRSGMVGSTNLQIRLSFDAFYNTTEDGYPNIYGTGPLGPTPISRAVIPIQISIGTTMIADPADYVASSAPFVVFEEGAIFSEWQADHTVSVINDCWTTVKKAFTVSGVGDGDIVVTFLDNIYDYYGVDQIHGNNASQQFQDPETKLFTVAIRNIQVELVNAVTGEVVANAGVKDTVKLDTNLTGKSPLEVSLTSGKGTYGCSRGAYLLGTWIDSDTQQASMLNGLYRMPKPEDSIGDDHGIPYTPQKLLLQSLISQYKEPRFLLSGTFDVTNSPLDIGLYLIKDTGHLGSRAFYILTGTYNDREEKLYADLFELEDTREAMTGGGES